MLRWKQIVGVAGLCLLAGLFARPAAAADPKVVTLVDATQVATLDGAFIQDNSDALALLVYNGLVRLTPDMTVQPDLAESWTVAEDKVTWTFRLRKNVKFSNGRPVTAQAVKFSLDRILDPATASVNRSALAQLQRVEAVDDATVRIVTKQPFPDLLRALADRTGLVHDPSEVAKYAVKEVGRNPVGSGPYKLAEWVPGQRLVFERNPHFTGPAPWADRLVFRTVPEAATRVAMIERGEADIAIAPPLSMIPALETNPKVKVVRRDGNTAVGLEFLTNVKPFDDLRVRQAVAYAIDQKTLLEKVVPGLGKTHCTLVNGSVGREYLFQQPCFPYDPDKAKALLADAGYPNGFEVELFTFDGAMFREVSGAIQAMLARVGIRLTVTSTDVPTFLARLKDPNRRVWLMSRAAGFTDFIFTRQFSKQEWDVGNVTRFVDPRVEELLVQARAEFDRGRRAQAYKEIQEIVWAKLPMLSLYTETISVITRPEVREVSILPTGRVLLATVKK